MATTVSPIPHACIHCDFNTCHWEVGSLFPFPEFGWAYDYGSVAIWFLRPSHKRQYDFNLVLGGCWLLEPRLHLTRKSKEAHRQATYGHGSWQPSWSQAGSHHPKQICETWDLWMTQAPHLQALTKVQMSLLIWSRDKPPPLCSVWTPDLYVVSVSIIKWLLSTTRFGVICFAAIVIGTPSNLAVRAGYLEAVIIS